MESNLGNEFDVRIGYEIFFDSIINNNNNISTRKMNGAISRAIRSTYFSNTVQLTLSA